MILQVNVKIMCPHSQGFQHFAENSHTYSNIWKLISKPSNPTECVLTSQTFSNNINKNSALDAGVSDGSDRHDMHVKHILFPHPYKNNNFYLTLTQSYKRDYEFPTCQHGIKYKILTGVNTVRQKYTLYFSLVIFEWEYL
jgi:hypothetical protein